MSLVPGLVPLLALVVPGQKHVNVVLWTFFFRFDLMMFPNLFLFLQLSCFSLFSGGFVLP